MNFIRSGEDPRADKKKKEKIPFQDVWDFYIDGKSMADKTRADRKGRYKKHMKDYFAKEVTVDNLKKFREDKTKEKKPLSDTSIDMLIAMCGTAINFWNAEQTMLELDRKPHKQKVQNPVPSLRAADEHRAIPKVKKNNRERYLLTDEIKELKAAVADSPDLNLFVHLALSTGARLATVMSIQKKDIKDGKITLINHKVGKKEYSGFIEPETQKLLDKRLPQLKVKDTLFRLEQRQIQRRLQYIMNGLFNEGLDGKDTVHRVMVHTLRHTFASHLVMKGVPLVKVQKLMSHKDISTTQIYAHLAPDAGRDDVMDLYS